jgi:endonuclease/exonuclease/phosphatase family metal-dependent hydrolase
LNHAEASPHAGTGRLWRVGIGLLVTALSVCLLPGLAEAAKGKKKKGKNEVVRVMTRNLYLGADLGPGLAATNVDQLVDGAGVVVNQVDATNFPVRAQGLAQEIQAMKPDLVGLQEVAWWRTKFPTDLNVFPPNATETEYDFLDLLLRRLNAKRELYRAVVVKPEFDFETPVNDQGPPGGLAQADRNARLTMRDVVLTRVGAGVKVRNLTSGTFQTLLRVSVAGLPIDVTRGWTALDARVRKSRPFHFVNTHFEAFDSGASNTTSLGTSLGKGQIRQAQALSLVAPGGPATSKLPVVLLGDLNSDDDTVQANGDHLAYTSLLGAGFVERSTNTPLSCCVSSFDLRTGSVSEFDHQVDHVMTDAPKKVKLKRSAVTGQEMVNGYWNSDHNGIASVLKVPKKKAKKKQKK